MNKKEKEIEIEVNLYKFVMEIFEVCKKHGDDELKEMFEPYVGNFIGSLKRSGKIYNRFENKE